MPPKKKPGYGLAKEKLQHHRDAVREMNRLKSINRGLSSPSINEWRREQWEAFRDRWRNRTGEHRLLKGKRICQQLKKGVHICNYYDHPGVKLRKGFYDEDGQWHMGMAYYGTPPLDVEAAYPYRTTLHTCTKRVDKQGRRVPLSTKGAKCVKFKHTPLKKWEKMLHGVPLVELE